MGGMSPTVCNKEIVCQLTRSPEQLTRIIAKKINKQLERASLGLGCLHLQTRQALWTQALQENFAQPVCCLNFSFFHANFHAD